MKKYLSLLLLMAFALRPAYYVGCFSYYELNIDYIIENYCVNTDKPELACNGKCYLSKQLTLSQEDSATDGESAALLTLVEAFIPLFYLKETPLHFNQENFFTISSSFCYTNLYAFELKNKLLRPPNT